MNRKISIDVESNGEKFDLVLRPEGMPEQRHPYDTLDEAIEAGKRGVEYARKNPNVTRIDISPEGAALMGE